MPKSENKQAIKDLFPGVFVGDNDAAYTRDVTYAIEDGMVQLQSFYQVDGRNPTGRQILRYMLQNVIYYLEKTSCKVYVLAFDKIDFVFKIKGIEHKKRAKKRTNTPAPDPQEGEKLLPLDKALPYNWSSMMSNRKARKHLIDELATLMCLHFCPPAGKLLVIDGALSDDVTQPVAIHCPVGTQTENNSPKCFIVGDSQYGFESPELSQKQIIRPKNLQNQVGEGDECVLFYLHYFLGDQIKHRETKLLAKENDPVKIDIITCDTDFIPNNLSFYHRLAGQNIDVRVTFALKKSKRETLGPVKDIMLVSNLYEALFEKLGKFMKRPDLGMVAAMMFSGNDYTDGYFGIVPTRALEVFVREAEYIGDLVTVAENGSWKLEIAAYLRFIRALYCDKYQKQFTKFIEGARKKALGKRAIAGDVLLLIQELNITTKKPAPGSEWKHISWELLRNMVITRNPKNPRAHIPTPKAMWLRYLRLQLNMTILNEGKRMTTLTTPRIPRWAAGDRRKMPVTRILFNSFREPLVLPQCPRGRGKRPGCQTVDRFHVGTWDRIGTCDYLILS